MELTSKILLATFSPSFHTHFLGKACCLALVQIGAHVEGRCFLTGDLFQRMEFPNGPGFLSQSPGTGRSLYFLLVVV
jgi:hypothetical protein